MRARERDTHTHIYIYIIFTYLHIYIYTYNRVNPKESETTATPISPSLCLNPRYTSAYRDHSDIYHLSRRSIHLPRT